jgi:4-amino-4-deoxy-L-arabinose transferase-like glycosyltransferase
MTFAGPCILIYFYCKTYQMHNTSNSFYFGTTLYMFFFFLFSPSIIRNLRLYIQNQVYVIQVLWLLANGKEVLYVQS